MNQVRCPRFNKCLMDCYHKKPHRYNKKYCKNIEDNNNVSLNKCPNCVPVIQSDVFLLPEDFEIGD